MAWRLGVRADREAEGLALDPSRPEHASDLPGRAGRDDRQIGGELLARAGRDSIVARRAGLDTHDPIALDDRKCLGLEADVGAGRSRSIDQRGIEPAARPDRTVVGEPAGRGPIELTRRRAGDHPQPPDAVGVGHVDVELAECTDRSRRQAVATHLVPAVWALLEHDDRRPEASRADRGGGAGGATSDDGDVDLLHTSTVPRKPTDCTVVQAK